MYTFIPSPSSSNLSELKERNESDASVDPASRSIYLTRRERVSWILGFSPPTAVSFLDIALRVHGKGKSIPPLEAAPRPREKAER